MVRTLSIFKNILCATVLTCLCTITYSQTIHEAVKTNNIKQIRLLLKQNDQLVNAVDNEKNTPLILACVDPTVSAEIIELLIEFGVDLSIGDIDNTTALHLAAYVGNIGAAKILIQHKAEIDFIDNRQQTPLLFAVVSGKIEIAKLLVENGANVNYKIEYTGTTLLHLALSRGKETMAEFLISKGAKIDVRDNRGRLPLYDALDIESHKIIDLILDKDTNINIAQDGTYLIDAAIAANHSRLVNMLIENGVDLKNVSPIGHSFMHKAAASGMVNLMKVLVDKEISIENEDVYGKMPIHIAIKKGQIGAVEFLLDKGASVNSKTPMGKTPLHLAQENEQTEIIALLIEHGAKEQDWKFSKLKGRYLDENLPKKVPQLFAPGIISTEENHDYALSFNPADNELLLSTRIYGESNYLSSMTFVNNQWSAPKRPNFASDFSEGEPIYSPDGQYLYFQSRRPTPGSAESNYDAWIIDYSKSDSTPQLLPEPFKEPQFLMYMSSTLDNKIYFTSNGGTYSAVKTETGYEEAVFLGGNINSPSEGKHPFIAPDESYLIFDASNRIDGLGESDLYISFRKEDGTWTRGQNMGDKINSPSNEICASISGNGKYMFFFSRRNGNGDIYWVDTSFINELEEKALKEQSELFKLQYQTLGKSRSFSIEHGDLDGDGYQDIFMTNYFSPSSIWFNNGDNTFEMKPDNIKTSPNEEHGGAIVDLDKDGDLDIVIVSTRQGENKIHLNDGTGMFTALKNQFLTKGGGYGHIYFKDADADGDLDAFLLSYQGSNELWLNDGSTIFTKSEQLFGDEDSRSMRVEDLDGDGDVDVFLTVNDAPEEVWLNDGKGKFNKKESSLGNLDGMEAVTLADFDNDGDIDAAVSNMTHGITIWLNDGEANFQQKGEVFSHGRDINHADIDNDGDIDLYASDRLHGDVILVNDGKANFSETSLINELSHRSGFVDTDNDGDLDLILSKESNSRGNGVYINQLNK